MIHLLRRMWAEHKLTRARKYLIREASKLKWQRHLGRTIDEDRLKAIADAADICWHLSWMT